MLWSSVEYRRKLDQVNNAKSAFILMINLLISQRCHSGLIGQGCPGGPYCPVGLGGSCRQGDKGCLGGQGSHGCQDGQGSQ